MVVGQPGKLVLTSVGCGFKSHPRRYFGSLGFKPKGLNPRLFLIDNSFQVGEILYNRLI